VELGIAGFPLIGWVRGDI